MTGVDPTTAPELAAIVWRDEDGDYWTFDGAGNFRMWWPDNGWSDPVAGDQKYADDAHGPLVAVGHLPAWTGPDDDVEPDVPAVTE